MPGPPRTPTQIRKAKGNPSKRAYNKREPKLPAGAPPMPDGLDATAVLEWKRLVAVCLEAGVLTKAHRSIVELAAVAYSEWAQARAYIMAQGFTYETTNTNGDPVYKKRVEVEVASDAWRRYRAAIVELGLTPAAQAKVSTVDPAEDEDPGAAYFN